MRRTWMLAFILVLGVTLACGLSGSEIEVVATPIKLPDATAIPEETAIKPTPVIVPVETPVLAATGDLVDVYAERTASGLTLHYADPATNREIVAVQIPSLRVTLAGEGLFFEGEDGVPVLASGSGQHIRYAVAAPRDNVKSYDFVISADGSTIIWLETRGGEEGDEATFWAAWDTRNAILPVYSEEVQEGESLKLVGLSADGRFLYFDRRTQNDEHTIFGAAMDLWALGVNASEAIQLPGEPGCGGDFLCDAFVSDDGRFLVRTMHPDSGNEEPVIVYDILQKVEIAQFGVERQDEEAAYEVGFPFLTPDGRRVVYALAEGPAGAERYSYFMGFVASGRQRSLAESGETPLRPVRWLDDETLVLTAEPAEFDEWHLNVTTGDLRRVSDRLYLGRVRFQ